MFIILWDVKEPAHLTQRVGHALIRNAKKVNGRVRKIIIWRELNLRLVGLGGKVTFMIDYSNVAVAMSENV